jgi:prepilin-type N-terminal cleavage/methylation domain-containing protein
MAQNQYRSEKGFTLIEITIVIVIAGILLSLLSSALLSYVKKNRITTTEHRMEKIEEALEQYLTVNRKYPCPASRIVGPDNATFGREVTVDCNTAAGSGAGVTAPTVRAGGVRIGAVPTRVLNLPDEFMADAWGNKFTYAVTEDLASSPRGTPLTRFFTPDGGQIIVQDSAGNELVQAPSNPNSRAHYVIVSHGPTGEGSYPLQAANTPPTPCPGTGLDRENCDHDDRVFRATLVNSDVGGANFFDDYIKYQGQTLPVPIIPVNAVMAFADVACPTNGDWEVYTPAQGRFVMGFDGTAPLVARTLYQLVPQPGTPTPTVTADNSVGTGSSGNSSAILPPYVTLIYCRKIR